MSDDEAAMVVEIKLEHLCLRKMTMIIANPLDRRVGPLAAEAKGAMLRQALFPVCQATADIIKRAA